jgi:hypothetical protein
MKIIWSFFPLFAGSFFSFENLSLPKKDAATIGAIMLIPFKLLHTLVIVRLILAIRSGLPFCEVVAGQMEVSELP